MTGLRLIRADGLLTVQDLGRPGHMAEGLSRGGAMDRMALIEAAALLGLRRPVAGIEMAGAGGVFEATAPMRVALTGAPMAATLDDRPLDWHAAHRIGPGERLRIGGARRGVYGYLVPAGGIATPGWLGSRAAHLSIGIGAPLEPGAALACGADPDPERPPRRLSPPDRFGGGTVRAIDGPQTALFDPATVAAFYATAFTRAPQGNRQGARFDADGRFGSDRAAGLASDMIGPGDIQLTGDGVPYVLLAECQTIGGYPRVGTVIAADLPVVAQCAPGDTLRFRRIGLEEADALWQTDNEALIDAVRHTEPLLRDPATLTDLLSQQLIGGVTRGDDLDRDDREDAG